MSIDAEALEVGLALCVGLGEGLGVGEPVDEADDVGEGVGASSLPLHPAKASVAAVVKATAYDMVVRDFIRAGPPLCGAKQSSEPAQGIVSCHPE